jgi:galactokinase
MIKRLAQSFAKRFGHGSTVVAFAPGRANLIGEHTDYNEGFVLPFAIGSGTYIAGAASTSSKIRIHSELLNASDEFDPDGCAYHEEMSWRRLFRGMVIRLRQEIGRLPAMDLYVANTLPLGVGLSSSASFEVALAAAMLHLSEQHLSPPAVARLCQEVENTFLGVACGIMDQFTVCLARPGHAIHLDCRTLRLSYVPFPDQAARLLIIDTQQPRTLAATAYNQRRAECVQALQLIGKTSPGLMALRDVTPEMFRVASPSLPDALRRRTEHVVAENARVERVVRALEAGDVRAVGNCLNESHRSLSTLYEVSTPVIDKLQEAMAAHPGVFGCRLMGAGFGGCVIVMVHPEMADQVEAFAEKIFEQVAGVEPSIFGAVPSAGYSVTAMG